MKNPFDPINNFDEWIQNDWESDDYIESHSNNPKKSQPESDPAATKIAWIITIALFIAITAIACTACR